MSLFGSASSIEVELLRKRILELETDRDLWRGLYMGQATTAPKQEAEESVPIQQVIEKKQEDGKTPNPIEALANALAEGAGLASPSKLTSWRSAKLAEHRKEQVALSTGPLERVEG